MAEKREVKGKGKKQRYTHLNAEFQRTARRDKKAFLSNQCKQIEVSEVIDRSPGNLDSRLRFIQPSVSHDVYSACRLNQQGGDRQEESNSGGNVQNKDACGTDGYSAI